jgi:superoxide oxidase
MPSPPVYAAPREFDPIIKLLHWLTLFLILVVFALAFSIDAVPRPEKRLFLQLHRSFGMTIWIVTFGRLVWRQFTRFPNWPATMSHPMRLATNASEYALYALLLIQPVLGLIQTSAHGDRVKLFFLVTLSPLTAPDPIFARQIHELHEMVGYALLVLIGLHAASGLYHHFWRRDNTLTAMLPHRICLADKAAAEQRVIG